MFSYNKIPTESFTKEQSFGRYNNCLIVIYCIVSSLGLVKRIISNEQEVDTAMNFLHNSML